MPARSAFYHAPAGAQRFASCCRSNNYSFISRNRFAYRKICLAELCPKLFNRGRTDFMKLMKLRWWERFQKYYSAFPELGLAFDLSSMNWTTHFLRPRRTA
jgi:hypothetical protein